MRVSTDIVANVAPTAPNTPAKIFSMVLCDKRPCILGASWPPIITPGTMKAMRFHGTSSPPRETIPPIWVPAATLDLIQVWPKRQQREMRQAGRVSVRTVVTWLRLNVIAFDAAFTCVYSS